MSSNDLLILGSRRATLALCASLLAACGQKGALYLPPPPEASAPGAPAAAASADGGPGR